MNDLPPSTKKPEASAPVHCSPRFIRVWQCIQCGEMTGGGITSQKKNKGIAGSCRFCGPKVLARLAWWNSKDGFVTENVQDQAPARLEQPPEAGEAHAPSLLPASLGSAHCGCRKCNPDAWWMVMCDLCGNKRCPHATDHSHQCTRSNEPGQAGSVFGPNAAGELQPPPNNPM